MFLALWTSLNAAGQNDQNDIVVIVHKNNPTEQMSHSQVIDLFMGKYVAFPNGDKARALDLHDSSEVKKQFYQALVKMSLARVNAYWSRIKFTGRARPPEMYDDENALLDYVSQTHDAIAYIPRSMLNNNVKIVYEFHE